MTTATKAAASGSQHGGSGAPLTPPSPPAPPSSGGSRLLLEVEVAAMLRLESEDADERERITRGIPHAVLADGSRRWLEEQVITYLATGGSAPRARRRTGREF